MGNIHYLGYYCPLNLSIHQNSTEFSSNFGVKRWQLCLQDTSRSAKCHGGGAVGHWVSLCVCSVVGWLIVYQLGILFYPLANTVRPSVDAGEMIA